MMSKMYPSAGSGTEKHSVHPVPPGIPAASASALDENAGSTHSCSTAFAPASYDSGVLSAKTRITAPDASSCSSRRSFHARPTLRTSS